MILFTVVMPNGHEYKLYADGHCTGFPSGACVINYAAPLLDLLKCNIGKEDFPCPSVTSKHGKISR